MKIFIGSDHNGFRHKQQLVAYLKRAGYDVQDDGGVKLDPADDFPLFAAKVVADIIASDDEQPRGILICGSGQGMCIAANRFKGIRAGLGYDQHSVRSARNDDDINVLCLPADTFTYDIANILVEIFLNTKFAAAPRFIRRLKEIDELT